MADRSQRIYCLDTSALVDLPIHYPRAVFGDTVWRSIEILISAGRLKVPREVRRELGRQEGDEIYRWVKSRTSMVVPLGPNQQRLLQEIMGRYPTWVDHQTNQPVADPIVIALARSYNPSGIVVAHETLGGRGAVKIPNVCGDYAIRCVTLPQMFVEEGWTYPHIPPSPAGQRRGR